MSQLLYVSRTARHMAADEVVAIHKQARDRNARRDITGLLLYGGGYFLQLLEGAASAVTDLYTRISRDPRHTEVRILFTQSCRRRIFPNWSMGLLVLDARPLDLARLHWIIDNAPVAQGPGDQSAQNMLIIDCIKEFRSQLQIDKAA